MKSYIFIYLLFIILPIFPSIAQNIDNNELDFDLYLNKKFNLQTHQLNQFVNRFNFIEPIIFDSKIPTRQNNILMLINYSDSSLVRKIQKTEFVQRVLNENYTLTTENNPSWFAKVSCQFNYKNKPIDIFLYLKRVGNNIEGYSWKIIMAESNLFKKFNKLSANDKFINPMNNEINFSELSKELNKPNDIIPYYNNNFEYNPLNSFRDYLLNEDIIFSHIKKLQYHFTDVLGYYITIDNFQRMDTNSGWLISSIEKN